MTCLEMCGCARGGPDGDGAVNQLEFLVGSNPLLPGDAFRNTIQPKAASAQIVIPRLANRAYEVQWSTHLGDANSWVVLDHPDNRPCFPALIAVPARVSGSGFRGDLQVV